MTIGRFVLALSIALGAAACDRGLRGIGSARHDGSGGSGGGGSGGELGPDMCLPGSPPGCHDTCLQAGTILKSHCAQCHDLGGASYGAPPFSFVLDVGKLITTIWHRQDGDSRFVVPGDPDHSQIYLRSVIKQDMPPIYDRGAAGGPLPRVNNSEGSVLQYWIASCLGSDPLAAAGGTGGQGPPDGGSSLDAPEEAGGAGGGGSGGGDGGGRMTCPNPFPGSDVAASCGTCYPATGFYGQNVLYAGAKTLDSNDVQTYEMAVDVPDPMSLIVTFTMLSGPLWGISDSDWRYTLWQSAEAEPGQQRFAPRLVGRNEARLYFPPGPGQVSVDFYECGSQTPTRTEIISWP